MSQEKAQWVVILAAGLATLSSAQASQVEQPKSRIAPQFSRNPFWDQTTLGLGVFFDSLNEKAAKRFTSDDPGMSVSIDQHVRGMFSGGLLGKLISWQLKNENDDPDQRVLVLSFLSRAEMHPPLDSLIGSDAGSILRPFLSAGVGYFGFLNITSGTPRYQNNLRGEAELYAGAGIRFAFYDRTALRFCFKQWKGIQSGDVGGQTLSLELQFGDLQRK